MGLFANESRLARLIRRHPQNNPAVERASTAANNQQTTTVDPAGQRASAAANNQQTTTNGAALSRASAAANTQSTTNGAALSRASTAANTQQTTTNRGITSSISSSSSKSATSSSSTSTTSTSSSSSRSVGPLAIALNVTPLPVAPLQAVLATGAATASITNPVINIDGAAFTGQAKITEACATPEYTFIPQTTGGGSYLVAPMVGCNANNAGCCPSLALTNAASSLTANSILETNANWALASAISLAPLAKCPSDYTTTNGRCCPTGFSLYSTTMLGQTPCVTSVTPALSQPTALDAQISTASSVLAGNGTKPELRVDNGEIFALSFPVATSGGLPTAAIIGIVIGVIAAILLAAVTIFALVRRRKEKQDYYLTDEHEIAAWANKDTDLTHHDAGSMTQLNQGSVPSTATFDAPSNGHQSYADNEHIPGPEQTPWDPSQQQEGRYYNAPSQGASVLLPAGLTAGYGSGQYAQVPSTDYDHHTPQQQQPYAQYPTEPHRYNSADDVGQQHYGGQQGAYYDQPAQSGYAAPAPQGTPPRWMG